MAQTFDLTVGEVRRDTRDSVVVTLLPPAQNKPAFDYIAGQYLTLIRTFDGEELRRCYSICSAREEQCLRVGIRHIAGGTFSRWANRQMKPGDKIKALQPAGNFHAPLAPHQKRHYLMFAGGSGITPILGLIKTILEEEPRATVSLVYGNRTVSSIMFREELEDLKNTHMNRLAITHILEHDASDIELFTGRLDEGKCAALFASWIDVSRADLAFICGPEPMMHALATALKDKGMAADQIRYELFAPSAPVAAYKGAAQEQGANNAGETCALTVHLDGAARSFEMPRQGMAVLDAALGEKLDVPHSCKAGVCSTCRARLVEGEVDMIANHALEDYEVKAGFILTCQSYPLSDKIVVDYDK